jgi:peptidoglycan/LPS O-acetylase OafA/YrhL
MEGLRAIVVLSVMRFHLNASVLPGSVVGVAGFFVISGYVVTRALPSDSNEPLGRFIIDFYARRLRRIGPALAACLLVTVCSA